MTINNQLELTGFTIWRPADGRIFDRAFAFDSETTLIDKERPWLVPAYVLGAAFDGGRGVFIHRDHLGPFLRAHVNTPLVMHNAPFDLSVIHRVVPGLDIYSWVERNLVWDTQLLHRLLALAVDGHTASSLGESTLETCAKRYLNTPAAKDVVDSEGRPVRLSFSRWMNIALEEIEPIYLEYLANDVRLTLPLYHVLREKLDERISHSANEWGYAGQDWLEEQIERWGPQTHHIQLKAAIVLREITANGLHIDRGRREQLEAELQSAANERLEELRKEGWIPGGKGSGKALQEILTKLERNHPDLEFMRTPTGRYATSREALESLQGLEPFIDALLAYQATQKLLSTYLDKMGPSTIHPSFNVLARTGRTTSYGDINAQNLPQDERIRNCFIPSEGHVYIDADYATIEMATLSQSLMSQFNRESVMGQAINAGKDLHRLVAARLLKTSEDAVSNKQRQKVKAINFGKPGGMGNATLQRYAKASYGVELGDDEVEELSDAWFSTFPEMKGFLAQEDGLAIHVARMFDLTPTTYFDFTGDSKFVDHPANYGRAEVPHEILGAMCLKVAKIRTPEKGNGQAYASHEIEYFWSQMYEQRGRLPASWQNAIARREASPGLQRAIIIEAGKKGVFTLTGRLRAQASFTARHNTVFQGLAADGAKLGLWRLWRSGYRIVNFIHDEIMIEVPNDVRLALHVAIVKKLMIEAMQVIVPDVRIGVSCGCSSCWTKTAALAIDERGRLRAA